MTSIQPELWVERPVEAVRFYEAAFGANVLHRVGDGDDIVAQLGVGDAAFWVAATSATMNRLSPRVIDGATSRTLLVVDDPDRIVQQAVAAGATASSLLGEEHGWRLGRVIDPFGHEWEIGAPLTASPPRQATAAEHADKVNLAEPYAPRLVAPLGIWHVRGWRIKRYSIAYRGAQARCELVAAAEAAAASILPDPATTATRYGVGFLGVHDGRGGNLVFIDWWEHENELHHHVLFSPADAPEALRLQGDADAIACVWDLSVVAHERAAWIRHILAASQPDLYAYLVDAAAGEV